MGKKQKKSSNSASDTVSAQSKYEQGDCDQSGNLHDSQGLFVRLRTTFIQIPDDNGPPGRMAHQIAMNLIDMKRLNVRDNDPVLLLLPRRDQCVFAAVCHAISASRVSGSKAKRRDSPGKPTLVLNEGEVSLFPQSFQECLMRKFPDESALKHSDNELKTPTKVNAPTVSTPLPCPLSARSNGSTPTVGFSFLEARKAEAAARTDFAKYGSPVLSSPSLSSNVDSAPYLKHIIISPLKTCHVAKGILNTICQPARRIVLRPVVAPDRQTSKDRVQAGGTPAENELVTHTQPDRSVLEIGSLSAGQHQMLRTLILARFCGDASFSSSRFLQPDEHQNMEISFQGLTRYFHVVSCSTDTNFCTESTLTITAPRLDEQLQSLSLAKTSREEAQPRESGADNCLGEIKHATAFEWMQYYLCQFDRGPSFPGGKFVGPPILLLSVTSDTEISLNPALTTPASPAKATIADQELHNVSIVTPRRQVGVAPQVAGLDSVVKELRSILTPALVYPRLFQPRFQNSTEMNTTSGVMRAPRGVLLFGPSGVGKSGLASQFVSDVMHSSPEIFKSQQRAQVQAECHHCISFASSSVMGDAERQITSIFSRAEMRSRKGVSTLIVLDDIHLICPRRGSSSGTSVSDSVAATLLALLDGISNSDSGRSRSLDRDDLTGNVVILGITANPSALDPALRRPGRLDREIEIPIPDDTARFHILRHQLLTMLGPASRSHDLLQDETIINLAKVAKGFTGSDTLLAVKEACRMALMRREKWKRGSEKELKITADDVRHAISCSNPSSIRHVAVQVPTVQWTDIGGMHDVKRLIRESIELPCTHSELFASFGIAAPKGVLLYGPPGCSKTMLARAMATEVNMNFLAVKGPELLSKWLGESERTLAALLRRARQASPCVIFFDEIDAIASKRGGADGSGGASGGERLLSQLLTELDGINSSREGQRVVVVGATNRPDLLDPALTRPGRIDRMIYVGVPDRESREHILRVGLKNRCCDDDVDYSYLSCDDITGGFSGAELIAICRDSAMRAIEEEEETKSGDLKIAMRHLMRSVKGTKKQITSEMIKFYDRFRRS